MIIRLKNKDMLIAGDFIFKCCIGKNGLKKHKIEGDDVPLKELLNSINFIIEVTVK